MHLEFPRAQKQKCLHCADAAAAPIGRSTTRAVPVCFHEKGRCAPRPPARGAATPTDPRQAGSGVQLGPPAGHGDQLRPHGGGQLVLKLLPFRRARSSTAPEQRTGPRCTSLLAAPRLGLGQRPRCLSVSAPQVRRTGRPGRHGRCRVAGHSLSALTSLRNGRRGERDVALHHAGLPAAPRRHACVC